MKVEARIFNTITFFFFISAIVYGVWSKEPVGTVALILVGGLSLLIGSYFQFVARRIEPRPEDNPEAEISDGAGEMGFFSPGSYWPFGLALAATMAATGLAFFQIWLVFVALIGLLGAIGGLLFEYYTGGRRPL